MVLLEECIEVLKADSEIFFDKKNDKLFENFESLIDFNEYGRIDWGKYPNRKIIKES
ncbi:CDI toxin immunity protein, partial [Tenacibaculum maritimum]